MFSLFSDYNEKEKYVFQGFQISFCSWQVQSLKEVVDPGERPWAPLIFRPNWAKKIFFEPPLPHPPHLRVWMTTLSEDWIHHWKGMFEISLKHDYLLLIDHILGLLFFQTFLLMFNSVSQLPVNRPLALRGHVTNVSLNNELESCWCQKSTEHIKIILHPKFEMERI